MISPGATRPLSVFLIFSVLTSAGLAQTPPAAPAPKSSAGQPLNLVVLEGNNVVNSIPLLRATAPVVEVRDQNELPVEGAAVIFTIPEQGGGSFAGGAHTFSTRTDSHGQATTPAIVPEREGKFLITVTATSGSSKGETTVSQMNSTGTYAGPPLPVKSWYKKKKTWILAGSAVAAVVVAVAVHRSTSDSSSGTIVITPGSPVFH